MSTLAGGAFLAFVAAPGANQDIHMNTTLHFCMTTHTHTPVAELMSMDGPGQRPCPWQERIATGGCQQDRERRRSKPKCLGHDKRVRAESGETNELRATGPNRQCTSISGLVLNTYKGRRAGQSLPPSLPLSLPLSLSRPSSVRRILE